MKVLYYFFGFLFICLAGFIGYIIKDANTIQDQAEPVELSSEYFLNKIENIVSGGWNKKLASKTVELNRPLANELYINLDLQDIYDVSKKKYFKLEIDKQDPFSMFCVKQALQNNELKYFLITNKKSSQIIVDVQDFSRLHELVDELENNKIKSKFTEIWL